METEKAKDILYLVAILAFIIFFIAAFEFAISYFASQAPTPRVQYDRYAPN